jgi:hypothetical protein
MLYLSFTFQDVPKLGFTVQSGLDTNDIQVTELKKREILGRAHFF